MELTEKQKAYNKRQHAAWFQKHKERELEKQRERRKELAYRVGCSMPRRKWVPITIKRALVKRANGRCERFDSSCKGGLTIHHIDRNPENNDLSNLELICKGHAAQEHELYVIGLKARGIVA